MEKSVCEQALILVSLRDSALRLSVSTQILQKLQKSLIIGKMCVYAEAKKVQSRG